MLSTPILISIVVSVAAAAVGAAGLMIFREYAGTRTLDERLDRLTGQKLPTLEAAGILKEPMFPENASGLLEKLLPKLPNLRKLFEQADFKWETSSFWLVTTVFIVAGAALPIIIGLPVYMPAISASFFGVLPISYVFHLRRRRLNKFGAQLYEALELVARALRAGHSLAAAMHTVATEMPDPIAKEFGRVYEEQNLGLGVEQAMRNLGDRIPNLDLKFFVTAVIIQRQTGGDLAEILDKIGYVIRERFKIMGMVRALTGEGRMSGIVLIALPFGLLLMMMNISPQYIALLWNHPTGRWMSMFGLISMAIGAIVIRKIVNIKI